MLKQKYFLTDFFILSAEKQPIKSSWRKIEWLHYQEQSNKLRKLLIAKNVNIKPYRVCDFYKEYFMPIC